VIGAPASVLGAGGFFVTVPGYAPKSTGSVDLYSELNASEAGTGGEAFSKTQLSVAKEGYFYHKAAFLDGDGDGLQDVMGARCFVPSRGHAPSASELVLMLQPAANAPSSGLVSGAPWEEVVVVSDGPDVSFALLDLDGDGKAQVRKAATQGPAPCAVPARLYMRGFFRSFLFLVHFGTCPGRRPRRPHTNHHEYHNHFAGGGDRVLREPAAGAVLLRRGPLGGLRRGQGR